MNELLRTLRPRQTFPPPGRALRMPESAKPDRIRSRLFGAVLVGIAVGFGGCAATKQAEGEVPAVTRGTSRIAGVRRSELGTWEWAAQRVGNEASAGSKPGRDPVDREQPSQARLGGSVP